MASLSRREFIQLGGKAVAFSLLPYSPSPNLKYNSMTNNKYFDVIIIGGSYAGLAAAMSLGRALIKTLIIDNGSPSNRHTPHSHNFLTNDGKRAIFHHLYLLKKESICPFTNSTIFGHNT